MKRCLNYSFLCLFLTLVREDCHAYRIVEEIVSSIEKATDFYSQNFGDMNIDGIFGLRVLEGQLKIVARFFESHPQLPDDLQKIYNRISYIYKQAEDISDASLLSLKGSNKRYFQLMSPVIQRSWSFERSYRRLDPSLKWKKELIPKKGVSLSETQSDNCMSELLGSQTGKPCSISKECVIIMSTPGMNGYGIIHQLLYTMLAEQSGCLPLLNSELLHLPNRSISVEQLQAEFCVNNFFETSDSVRMQNGIINEQLHDLFLEQEFTCAMLGYIEFLHLEWLQQIISWQKPSGCYALEEQEKSDPLMEHKNSKSLSYNKPVEAAKDVKFEKVHSRQTSTGQHLPLDKRIAPSKQKQMGNLGSLDQIVPFVHKEPNVVVKATPFQRLDLRIQHHNDSRVQRAAPVKKNTPLQKGKFGDSHIGTSRSWFKNLNKANGEHLKYVNHEQGKVGDTSVRIKQVIGSEVGAENRIHDKLLEPVPNQDMGVHEESFKINRQINRKLLYEVALKDGCLAHKTAVAMGALTQYLRFVIFANSSNYDALKHLHGTNYLMHPDDLRHSNDVAQVLKQTSSSPLQKPTESSIFKDKFDPNVNNLDWRKEEDRHPIHGNVVSLGIVVQDSNRLSKNISMVDIYEEDASVQVLATHQLQIVKSDEDELLLYDELQNVKPKSKSASKTVDSNQVKASHDQVMVDSSLDGVTSISSTYGVVIVVTAVILLLLYKTLRRHRFGIQHRQSRWR